MYNLYCGDCLNIMQNMADNSVDSIITDPPYGISFMQKDWDYSVPSVDIWKECLRLLKPGGHLLSFAGTRTQHRMAVNIEDAGFEIRDMLAWIYGNGLPKSTDISKTIDKAAGAERKVIGRYRAPDGRDRNYEQWKISNRVNSFNTHTNSQKGCPITAPATEDAKKWSGWGTTLKPSFEPITMARKPFKGSAVNNVLKYGTGAINIDDCRIKVEPEDMDKSEFIHEVLGRFPSNLIHDGSKDVLSIFPNKREYSVPRFFYCAKVSKRERNEGCEKLKEKCKESKQNYHPTVKPVDLMRYLCKLITPPNGVILDPFMGSGSTGKAALLEHFNFIGIEMNKDYVEIAKCRIEYVETLLKTQLF